MELWIRSQDKEILMLVNTITLAADEIGTIIGIGIDGKIKIPIGTYKTKERALEILNAIQQAMIEQSAKNERSELIGGLGFGSIPKKNVFIQMPEE